MVVPVSGWRGGWPGGRGATPEVEPREVGRHLGGVSALAISPRGQVVSAGNRDDFGFGFSDRNGRVLWWDPATPAPAAQESPCRTHG